jgi:hypothetical protein
MVELNSVVAVTAAASGVATLVWVIIRRYVSAHSSPSLTITAGRTVIKVEGQLDHEQLERILKELPAEKPKGDKSDEGDRNGDRS